MESTARLYHCVLCHIQVIICRPCDRGNIYCPDGCASRARTISLKLASARYQATLNGKHHHAARQAHYRARHQNKVTHQGSPPSPPYAPIRLPENKAENPVNGQQNTELTCCFCHKTVSDWLRHDFLRQRDHKKQTRLQACPQAP
ncbi:TPA: hypothetical protein ACP9DH_001353 [Legionella anisa]